VDARQTEMIRIRLTPDLRAWLEAQARRKELTTSGVVRTLLAEAREAEQYARPMPAHAQPA
jgi:hypothetical protein